MPRVDVSQAKLIRRHPCLFIAIQESVLIWALHRCRCFLCAAGENVVCPGRHTRRVDHRGAQLSYTTSYNEELHAKVLEKMKCHSVVAAASMGCTPASTVHYWAERMMRQYVAECWKVYSNARGVIQLQLDGTRIGQPAKETVMYVYRNARLDQACVLPPQAGISGKPKFCPP